MLCTAAVCPGNLFAVPSTLDASIATAHSYHAIGQHLVCQRERYWQVGTATAYGTTKRVKPMAMMTVVKDASESRLGSSIMGANIRHFLDVAEAGKGMDRSFPSQDHRAAFVCRCFAVEHSAGLL